MECTEPDGITRFYYNISTGESSWIEPEEVRRTVKSLEQLGEMVEREAGRREVLATVDQSAWQERMDAAGKTFYYNTVTKSSVWEMPAELREWREATSAGAGSAGTIGVEQREKREREFIKLLEEKGVGPAWSWEDTLKEIIGHSSYKALPTLAERKACFLKYIEELKSRKARDGKRQDPRDDFLDSLISLRLPRTTRYSDVEERAKRWDCYNRLSPRERLDLFDHYIRQLDKQYRQAMLDEVTDYLYSARFEFGRVGWEEVRAELTGKFPVVPREDLLVTWERYILDCEERTIQQAHCERKALLAQETECSLAFRKFLVGLHESGQLHFESSYQDLLPTLSASDHYKTLCKIAAHRPLLVYLYYVDELEDEFEYDRAYIERLLEKRLPLDERMACLRVLNQENVARVLGRDWRNWPSTSTSMVQCAPSTAKPCSPDPESTNKDLYRPQIDKYKQLLKRLSTPHRITLTSLYADFAPVLRAYPEHNDLPEPIRLEYFEKYQMYLKRKMEETDGGGGPCVKAKIQN
jgi:pre-mRNA-processing factor 40